MALEGINEIFGPNSYFPGGFAWMTSRFAEHKWICEWMTRMRGELSLIRWAQRHHAMPIKLFYSTLAIILKRANSRWKISRKYLSTSKGSTGKKGVWLMRRKFLCLALSHRSTTSTPSTTWRMFSKEFPFFAEFSSLWKVPRAILCNILMLPRLAVFVAVVEDH